MSQYIAGATITLWVTLFDGDRAPITTAADSDFSESFDHEATDGTLTAATVGTWSHRSNGRYKATISNAVAGKYHGTVTYNGTPKQPFAFGDIDVLTAAQADPAAALAGASITVVSPIGLTGDIALTVGDAASLPWTSSDWADLTSATVTFQAYKLVTDEAVFASAKSVTKTSVGGASQTVTLALLSTDTDDFVPGVAYRYELDSTSGLLASGKVSARGS